MKLTDAQRQQFAETLWEHYTSQGRHDLPWRQPEPDGSFDPYKILVSELMLQQTQVARVIPKYHDFLTVFPTVDDLARADLAAVLRAWQGLGYNRRAKFLWQAARAISEQGAFPDSHAELVKLPGVGANTAGAVLAYAGNQPAVFVETNIRTVYIHHFTRDNEIVSDDFVRDLLRQTLDWSEGKEQPEQMSHHLPGAMRNGAPVKPALRGDSTVGLSHYREFYWALMDYGAWLKKQVRNNSQSKHYTRQSKFEGSRRQVRGRIVRELAEGRMTPTQIEQRVEDGRVQSVLEELLGEGMITKTGRYYHLGSGTM